MIPWGEENIWYVRWLIFPNTNQCSCNTWYWPTCCTNWLPVWIQLAWSTQRMLRILLQHHFQRGKSCCSLGWIAQYIRMFIACMFRYISTEVSGVWQSRLQQRFPEECPRSTGCRSTCGVQNSSGLDRYRQTKHCQGGWSYFAFPKTIRKIVEKEASFERSRWSDKVYGCCQWHCEWSSELKIWLLVS